MKSSVISSRKCAGMSAARTVACAACITAGLAARPMAADAHTADAPTPSVVSSHLASGSQLFEETVAGLRAYIDSIKAAEPQLYAQLAPDVEHLESQQATARTVLVGGACRWRGVGGLRLRRPEQLPGTVSRRPRLRRQVCGVGSMQLEQHRQDGDIHVSWAWAPPPRELSAATPSLLAAPTSSRSSTRTTASARSRCASSSATSPTASSHSPAQRSTF